VVLERVKASLPFSYTINGHLNSRNAGGHPGNPSHMINPQYKIVIKPDARKATGVMRMVDRVIGRFLGMLSLFGGTGVEWLSE
jgi:hypothetical protein